MFEPLEEQYFTWLYSQVASIRVRNPARTYYSLLRQLHRTQYVWFVPNDDNRMEDGRDLRDDFIRRTNLGDIPVEPEWMSLGCSMLEMMLALSRRLSFEDVGRPRDWFWHLLRNLEIDEFNDDFYAINHPEDVVDDILLRVIYRTYNSDGSGGLFPLNNPTHDQRKVEVWYQLSEYLLERA